MNLNDCDLTPADFGYYHQDDIPNVDLTRDFLQGMLEAVYETGDIDMLERCLEELCYEYCVKYELKAPKMRKA